MWASGVKSSGGGFGSPSYSKVTFTDAAPGAQGDNLTKIDFDTVVYDALSEWDVAINHQCDLNESGYYHVSARVKVASQGAGFDMGVRIYVNGVDVTVQASQLTDEYPPFTWVSASGDVYAAATDHIEVKLEQLSGGSTTKIYFAMCEIHRIA